MTDLSQSVSSAPPSSLPINSAQPAVNTQAIEGVGAIAAMIPAVGASASVLTAPSNTATPPISPEITSLTPPSANPSEPIVYPNQAMTLDAAVFTPPSPQSEGTAGIPFSGTPAITPPQPQTEQAQNEISGLPGMTAPAQQSASPSRPVPIGQTPQQPNTALPSIEEMEQKLRQDTNLLPGIEVQQVVQHAEPSILAALQPNQTGQATGSFITPIEDHLRPTPLPQVELATSKLNVFKLHLPGGESGFSSWPLSLLISIVLAGQVMIALIQSLYFMIVQYPKLDALIIMDQLTQTQLNLHFIKLGVLGFFALASITTMIVTLLQLNKPAHKLVVGIGLTLCVANVFIQTIFVKPELIVGNPFWIPGLVKEITAQPATSSY